MSIPINIAPIVVNNSDEGGGPPFFINILFVVLILALGVWTFWPNNSNEKLKNDSYAVVEVVTREVTCQWKGHFNKFVQTAEDTRTDEELCTIWRDWIDQQAKEHAELYQLKKEWCAYSKSLTLEEYRECKAFK